MVRVALLSVVLATALIAGSAAATTEPKPTEGVSNGTPPWSPEGSRIAYFADEGLHVIGADGSGNRFVAATSEPALGDAPWSSVAWSPDSTRLAFIRGVNVYVVDADGSNLRRMTEFGT